MTMLNQEEIEAVTGANGVAQGPNGEGCTEPRGGKSGEFTLAGLGS